MKLSTGLVLIALAVTAANAYNVRSVEEEEPSENHPVYADGKVSDDDSFFALFGSGSGSKLLQAQDSGKMLDLPQSSSYGDAKDTMNVKGGKKNQANESADGMYPLDVVGTHDDTKFYVNTHTGTLGSQYIELTEDLVRGMFAAAITNPHADLSSDEFEWIYRTIDWLHKQSVGQSKDSVNVKGGKQGVPVDDSSLDDLDASNETHYYIEILTGPSSGRDFPVFTKKEFLRLFRLMESSPDCDPITGACIDYNDELIFDADDSNVKSGKQTETDDTLDNKVEVKDGASSPAAKSVKTSSVSAHTLNDDDSKGILSEADEEDSTNVKKSDHEYQMEESDAVNEKMTTKISEPFD